MKVPFLDLSVKDSVMKHELLGAVEKVLTHGRLMLGPELDTFEREIAEYCQMQYALGVSSGTDALYLALRGLGIGPGDEVITTPLSWIATFNAISLCGATPVCVDIKKDLTLDEKLIPSAITSKTKAIIPVHFTGQMCEMNLILEIANQYNLFVVEDAAQAFGSLYHGKKAGSFGVANCFSMNPMKVFNAYGEAGAILTNIEDLHQKLISLRYAGTVNKEECLYPSHNGRMDTIQAAMLSVSFKYLGKKIKRRREIAKNYTNSLQGVVFCPEEKNGELHSYYSYTIIALGRDKLKAYLAEKGIETKIQHLVLMPRQKAYQHLPQTPLPNAEKLVDQILCIPASEILKPSEQDYVIECVKSFYS